jgi:hypothetical protein
VPLGLGVAAPVDGWSYPSLAGTLTPMTNSPHPLDAKPFDFWLARAAILVIVVLQLGLVNDLTVGPRWLAPALELGLLIPLPTSSANSFALMEPVGCGCCCNCLVMWCASLLRQSHPGR